MATPTNRIYLLENVDINSDYLHTYKFETRSTQLSFFQSKIAHSFTDVTFVRKGGTVKVDANIETIIDSGYMMFQNTEFGTRWYYAFITDMKFINRTTTEITFEIDVIQTWGIGISDGDVSVLDSMIEREHVSSDSVGEHLVRENIDVGEMTFQYDLEVTDMKDLTIVAAVNFDFEGYGDALLLSGNINGLSYFVWDDDFVGVAAFVAWLDGLSETAKTNITSIFMMPTFALPSYTNGDLLSDVANVINSRDLEITYFRNLQYLNGYEPKNNKLFAYPYNFLRVSNNQGGYTDIRYEKLSNNSRVEMIASCEIAPNPTVILYIENYQNIDANFDEGVTLTGYPQGNWINNSYELWAQQNKGNNFTSAVVGAGALAAGIITSQPLAALGGVYGIISALGSYYDAGVLPNQSRGSVSGSAMLAHNKMNFTCKDMTVTAEHAEIIDGFFTKFGYKVNRLGTPSFNNRPYFTYTKLAECTLKGDAPNVYKERIIKILLDGITFWNGEYVGNYSLNNIATSGSGGGTTTVDSEVNSLGFDFPLADDVSYVISSEYGDRTHPITGEPDFHEGIDLACDGASKIVSALPDGELTAKGYSSTAGYYAYVDYTKDGDTYQAIMYHMQGNVVADVGYVYDIEEVIGFVGTTGSSTGNHLHFGLKKNGNYVDPWDYINPSL